MSIKVINSSFTGSSQTIKSLLAIGAIAKIMLFAPAYGQAVKPSVFQLVQSPILTQPTNNKQLTPTSTKYFERGLKRLDAEDYLGAIADFNIVLDIEPNNAYAYVGRGLGNLSLENYQVAKRDFDKAIEIDPDLAHTYFFRGVTRYKLLDREGAIADLEEASTMFTREGKPELVDQVNNVMKYMQQNSRDRVVPKIDPSQIV